MKNRFKAYGLAFAVMAYMMRGATDDYQTNLLLAGLVASIIALVSETITKARKRSEKQLELANRRDCIIIAGAWPSKSGDSYGPDLGPAYNEPIELYEYHDSKYLEAVGQDWEDALFSAGNQSVAEGLAEELRLPIILVYPQSGSHRMETREEYADRLRRTIREANNAYHAALEEQNDGKNYIVDYLVKR